MAKTDKPDFTRLNKKQPSCILYTIEYVVDRDSVLYDESDRSIQYALEQLQTLGAAEVVSSEKIAEDFDTAYKILRARMPK